MHRQPKVRSLTFAETELEVISITRSKLCFIYVMIYSMIYSPGIFPMISLLQVMGFYSHQYQNW